MKTPIINQYYLIQGIENALVPFSIGLTFTEIAFNEGEFASTELMYALQEQRDIIETLQMYAPTIIKASRDNESSIAIITKVSLANFKF
jgi:hypothetical protein